MCKDAIGIVTDSLEVISLIGSQLLPHWYSVRKKEYLNSSKSAIARSNGIFLPAH